MRKTFRPWLHALLVVGLAVALVLAGCAGTPSNSSPTPGTAVSSPGPLAEAAPGGVPEEGIQVHGDWTIEVRNPDGTVVERREFENAFNGISGSLAISQFLSRTRSVGAWDIVLSKTTGLAADLPFLNSAGNSSFALLLESSYPYSEPNAFETLTVSSPTSGGDAYKLLLTGTAIAQRNGAINWVATRVVGLPGTVAPASTYEGAGQYSFTATELSSPVSLVTGQQLLVTVKISFS